MAPLEKEIMGVTALKDKNRPSPFFDHLSVVADGIPALGWVLVVRFSSTVNLKFNANASLQHLLHM